MSDELKRQLDALEIPNPSSNFKSRIIDAAKEKNRSVLPDQRSFFSFPPVFRNVLLPAFAVALFLIILSPQEKNTEKKQPHLLADISFFDDFEDDFFEDTVFMF